MERRRPLDDAEAAREVEGQVEELDASYYPHDVPKTGLRKIPFSRELWVDRDDFMEDPPKKFLKSSNQIKLSHIGKMALYLSYK